MSGMSPRTPFASRLASYATDIAGVAGAALVTYGVSLINHPAAFIVAGGFLLGGAWLSARNAD